MQLRKPATAILALALSAGLAQADDAAPAAGSTLDKIAKNGVIVVGHRESSVPFSYYDNQQKVVGYSQDYSNAIVEAVKKKLNKPDLQVKLIPITSQNRIPLLQTQQIEIWVRLKTALSILNAVLPPTMPNAKNRRLSLTLFSWSVRAC